MSSISIRGFGIASQLDCLSSCWVIYAAPMVPPPPSSTYLLQGNESINDWTDFQPFKPFAKEVTINFTYLQLVFQINATAHKN